MLINNIYADDENEIIALQEEIEIEPEANSSAGWTMLMPCALMLVIFYFLLLRPQEKKRKAHEELVKNVKKGEQIITSSGIYGIVNKVIDEHSLEIEIAPNVLIKILKTAVVEVSNKAKPQPQEKKQLNKEKKSARSNEQSS